MGVDMEVRREVAAPKEMTPETTGYGVVMLRCATATENNVEWTSKERHRTTATTEEDVKWDVMRKSAIDDDEVDVVIARDNGAKTLRCATAPSEQQRTTSGRLDSGAEGNDAVSGGVEGDAKNNARKNGARENGAKRCAVRRR